MVRKRGGVPFPAKVEINPRRTFQRADVLTCVGRLDLFCGQHSGALLVAGE